ncbi:hypothetical protein CPB85DRAFT_1435015 [Mucidula mucida]|nr:hypothetical protein CPB85DRAFT_1435015 [Mucidula mucida]
MSTKLWMRNPIRTYSPLPRRIFERDLSRGPKEKSAPKLSCISLPESAQQMPASSLTEEDDEIILYPRAKRAKTEIHSPSCDNTSFPLPDENIRPVFTEYKDTAPRPADDEHDPGFVIWADGGMNIPLPEERLTRKPFAVLYQDESQDEPLSVLPSSSLLLEFGTPASRAGEISPIVTPRLMGFTSDQQNLLEALTQN